MREKRQHPRADLVTTVEIVRIRRDEGTPLAASPAGAPSSSDDGSVKVESRDISHGGMFLVGPLPWPVGTELSLAFNLPGLGSTHIPGFVRWHRSDGFGVQFGLLGARETHAIGRMIRNHPQP